MMSYVFIMRPIHKPPLQKHEQILPILLDEPKQFPHDLLSVGLLQQGTPELIVGLRVDKHQSAVVGWKAIVNNHLYPLAVLPELEVEGSTVVVAVKALILWAHSLQQVVIQREGCQGSKEPTVTCKENCFLKCWF